MISLQQPGILRDWARQLQLGWTSTANLFGSYYFGRRAILRKFFPAMVVLEMPKWGKVPLRTNGHDPGLLEQIFVRQDYHLDATGVRRILDLGANIGMASLYLSRLFPEAEIACVEPSPQNIPLLEKVIALNGMRARVFKAAAGAEAGSIDLHIADSPDCNSIYPVDGSTNVVSVPLIPVPEIMRQMGWDQIDLLKIDIEGAEKEVLHRNNAWLQNVRIITGESHINVGYPFAALQADLQAAGFSLKALIPETADHGASFLGERLAHPAN